MSDPIDKMLAMLIISRSRSPGLMKDNDGQSDREVLEHAIEAGVVPTSTERYLDHYNTTIYPENHMNDVDYRKVIVPVEPVDYDAVGLGLFKNGFVRVAREEMSKLVLGFIDAVESNLDIEALSEFWKGVIRWDLSMCRELLPTGKEFEEKIENLKVLLGELPAKVRDVFSISTTAKAKKPKEPELEMSLLALEQCNRGCPHCAVCASVGLPKLKFRDLEKWTKIISPGSWVAITYGEPFYWNDGGKNIADIVKLLLEFPDTQHVEIVTSGINFSSKKEKKAAEDLAALPLELRKKISFTLSVSTFPNFRVNGAQGGVANQKVLQDTMRFAWENGVQLTLRNFLPKKTAFETLVAPVVRDIKPDAFEEDCLVIENSCLKGAPLQEIGRHGENSELGHESEGEWPSSKCLFGVESAASMKVAVAGDGAVLPGCCHFTVPFVKLGDLNTEDHEELKEKVTAFIRMGRKTRGITDYARKHLSEEKLSVWKDVKESKASGFNCDDCMVLGRELRHPKRAVRAIGKWRFRDVQQNRMAKIGA